MNTQLVLRIVSASAVLSVGELLILAGLPWFSSPIRSSYVIPGLILGIIAITYLCFGLLNDSKIKIMVRVIISIILAIIGTISVVALSFNLEFNHFLLDGTIYDIDKVVSIFNLILFHIVLMQKKITQSTVIPISISLILCFIFIIILDKTFGELVSSFPVDDFGIKGWILTAIYTPILWLTAFRVTNQFKAS